MPFGCSVLTRTASFRHRVVVASRYALVEWVVGRQHMVHPTSRQEITYKAGTINALASGQAVESGWYWRFMDRHPTLSSRTSEAKFITKTRNRMTNDDSRQRFNTLLKVVIESKMDGARVFNKDETVFQTGKGPGGLSLFVDPTKPDIKISW